MCIINSIEAIDNGERYGSLVRSKLTAVKEVLRNEINRHPLVKVHVLQVVLPYPGSKNDSPPEIIVHSSGRINLDGLRTPLECPGDCEIATDGWKDNVTNAKGNRLLKLVLCRYISRLRRHSDQTHAPVSDPGGDRSIGVKNLSS